MEPDAAEKEWAGSDFLLPDLRCRLSAAERLEAAVASRPWIGFCFF